MATNHFKVKNGVKIESGGTGTESGDLTVNSNRLEFHNGTSAANVVTTSSTDTLTNKSIDADTNTITNIENADIKAGAAIDATKIGTGSVDNTEFGYLDGVTGAIQTQINSKASSSDLSTHTGASSGVHGVTGSVVGTSDSQTLTNKTIDADLNTISNIENADIKAGAAIDAAKIHDGSVSNTEFGYLDGVTSSIQTQLNGKQAAFTDSAGLASALSDETGTGSAVFANTPTLVTPILGTPTSGTLTNCTGLPLTTGVTGTLADDNGGTGQSTYARGDILYASAADTLAKLTIGAANTFLSSDGTDVSWATPAGSPVSVVSKTTTYTATTSDDVILADTSGGAWTLTLYAASGNSGKRLRVKKTTSDLSALTIDGNSSETIDGTTTTTINTQYESIELICDGSNWHILERNCGVPLTSYTPTITHDSGTITNHTITAYWTRVGDQIKVFGDIVFSSASGAFGGLYIALPTNISIDTGKLPTTTAFRQGVGTSNILDSGVNIYSPGICTYASTTKIAVISGGYITAHSGTVPVYASTISNTFPFTFGASDAISFTFEVPVSGWKA